MLNTMLIKQGGYATCTGAIAVVKAPLYKNGAPCVADATMCPEDMYLGNYGFQQLCKGTTKKEVLSCSISCIAPPPASGGGGGGSGSSSSSCFPATSFVELNDGSAVRMDALKVGHSVRVGPKEHSEVFMFSHQYTDAQATFVQLQTATSAIQLTADHYLYVNGKAAQASTVKVGDFLETADGKPAAVSGVTTVRATGLYNPHTIQGDIIVNGFRTTTYTDAINPILAHAMLAPVRALYAMNVTLA
jgi:hypothetical protein